MFACDDEQFNILGKYYHHEKLFMIFVTIFSWRRRNIYLLIVKFNSRMSGASTIRHLYFNFFKFFISSHKIPIFQHLKYYIILHVILFFLKTWMYDFFFSIKTTWVLKNWSHTFADCNRQSLNIFISHVSFFFSIL